jgi:hypothetical protein
VWRGEFCPVDLPNCWRLIVLIFPKSDGCQIDLPEQLQQFGKSTWHSSNFGKIRKNGLQQFGKPTWQK